jgi:hypothetical protein
MPRDACTSRSAESTETPGLGRVKKRAGRVGATGLGPAIADLCRRRPSLRVHLIGHSFGARLVSYALTGLPPGPTSSPVKSVTLLQGAFSHFAFAGALPHDPGRAGALAGMQERVDGPLLVSHSRKDTAVGVLYPHASWLKQDDAAAFGAASRWGAMGYDGAQAVNAHDETLGDVGAEYPSGTHEFVNLNANHIISKGKFPSGAHSDIHHPSLAWATLSAAGIR